MRDNRFSGTNLERAAVDAVRQRLPSGWSVELGVGAAGAGRALLIQAPDGRSAALPVKSRKRLSPRDVPNLLLGLEDSSSTPCLIVAPFVSPRSRELLAAYGASYVDTTGNLRVVIRDPAVFLEGRGQDRDPARRPRPLKSLKGAAAGRVVRALCDFLPPYGVRTLAESSSISLGSVSRVVSLLEEEALLTRDARKQITAVDWPSLIMRWGSDYSIRTSNDVFSYLEPRGLPALAGKLARLERYAVTGSMAGPGVAPARLAMIYVDDANAAAQALELAPTDAGANVWLLEPYDEVVFERTRQLAFGASERAVTVVAVAPSQVAVDLLGSPGRGPQEAQALIEQMKETEHAWRERPRV